MSAPFSKEIDLDHTGGFEFSLFLSCLVEVTGHGEYDVSYIIYGDMNEKVQLSQLDPRDQLKLSKAVWDVPQYAMDLAFQEYENNKQSSYQKYAGF